MMKAWYYWMASGILAGLLAYYKYRYSKLKEHFENLSIAMREMLAEQKLNLKANEKKQKTDTVRETDPRLQRFNPDDPWDGLRR